MKVDPIKLTAQTLIEKALELDSNYPDHTTWLLDEQGKSLPGLQIRLKQLDVLIKVFIPESEWHKTLDAKIESVLSGEFILRREIKDYSELFLAMDNEIVKSKVQAGENRNGWELHTLKHNYEDLLSYKRKLSHLLKHNSGIMEISYPYYFSVIITDEISKKANSKKVDKFLATVVDPQSRSYSKAKLMAQYKYPSDAVADFDLDDW